MVLNSVLSGGTQDFKNRGDDKHAGRTALKTFAIRHKLCAYYSIRVSMSSVWLIKEILGWGLLDMELG